MTEEAARSARAVETVFRMERPRLIAGLARLTRDLGLAEDLAQEALLAALEVWPRRGIPQNPAGWLLVTAKRRAIDLARRKPMLTASHAEIARRLENERDEALAALEAALDDPVGDDRLALIFTACHPALSLDSRVALTLRLVAGLTTAEIARAFLTGDATIAQRITRAKKRLSEAAIAYEVPAGAALAERLDAVLEVLYLVFNEAYAASDGAVALRPSLAAEVMRLGRILAQLMPGESRVHALLALMELQASRFPARTDARGLPVPLDRQNRARWDRLLIGRGLEALARARALHPADEPYCLQAEIAACHATAPRFEATDWPRIAGLYRRLAAVHPSPVVLLNAAVAEGMATDARAGLAALDRLAGDPDLAAYPLYHAARGDMLARLDRPAEASAAFARAALMSRNGPERDYLRARAEACRQAFP